jgi:hypothetical protein
MYFPFWTIKLFTNERFLIEIGEFSFRYPWLDLAGGYLFVDPPVTDTVPGHEQNGESCRYFDALIRIDDDVAHSKGILDVQSKIRTDHCLDIRVFNRTYRESIFENNI